MLIFQTEDASIVIFTMGFVLQVGSVTAICFTCFLIRCVMVTSNYIVLLLYFVCSNKYFLNVLYVNMLDVEL